MSLALGCVVALLLVALVGLVADNVDLHRRLAVMKLKLALSDYGHVPRLEACEMCGSDPDCPHCEGEGIRCIGKMKP